MMSLRSPLRSFQSPLWMPLTSNVPRNFLRYVSLNSAIGRGIRRSQRLEDPRLLSEDNRDRGRGEKSSFRPRGNRGGNEGGDRARGDRSPFRSQSNRGGNEGRDRFQKPDFDGNKFHRRESFRPSPREDLRSGGPRGLRTENGPPAATRSRPAGYDSTPDSWDRRRGRDGWEGKKSRPAPSADNIDEDEFIRTGNFRGLPREHQRFKSQQSPRDHQESRTMGKSRPPPQDSSTLDFEHKQRPRRDKNATHHKATERSPERVKEHVKIPDTIPYTTPASEFIYGTAAVEAALRCSQRQLYKLYLYQAAEDEELNSAKAVLRKLALSKDVKVKMAFAEWDRLLDKMSAGRPHNGCILEASPLPRMPVRALKSVQPEEDHIQLELAPQTREEASVNGTKDRIPINVSAAQQHKRQPVVLLLDGIVDPGNLGAIIRSAYYLGVDAVVFAGRNSAPLSPITIKASAGAAENMTLLDVKNEVDFIQRSKANGWRFYAADALTSDATYIDPTSLYDRNSSTAGEGERTVDSLIGHSPSVIMMGNEGSGLSNHIRTQADSIVSIPGARLIPGHGITSDPARVDSLNVSVAAALLMETFLRVPLGVSPTPRKKTTG
ncbi:Alpha/beta knot methyltransferase [Aspergillus varians]